MALQVVVFVAGRELCLTDTCPSFLIRHALTSDLQMQRLHTCYTGLGHPRIGLDNVREGLWQRYEKGLSRGANRRMRVI